MLKRIASKESLIGQAQRLKNRKFKPGFDNMTPDAALMWIEINSKRLTDDIISGRYTPMPAVGFRVAKKNGGYRKLARLTALDTIIQNSVIDAIEEKVEEHFSDSSFAYRSGRGVASALQQYLTYGSQYSYAAVLDPVSCYDNIDHSVLIEALNTFGLPINVIELIRKFIEMPVMTDEEITANEKGLIQGAPLSGMLCNVYFDLMDKYLEENNIPFIRYADDIVLFSNSLTGVRADLKKAEYFLNEKLKLQKNERKFKVDSPSRMNYLGHSFVSDRHGLIALEDNVSVSTAYYKWHRSVPEDNRRRVDILSDGILKQQDYSLLFESDAAKTNIPIATTNVINIYSNVIFDSGFLGKALNNGIIINVFGQNDKLIGHFYPDAPLKSPRVTNEQITAYYDTAHRLELAKQFVLASIHNLRLNIRYYNKQNPLKEYDAALRKINALAAELKQCGAHGELLLLEAQVRQIYYGCFDSFISAGDFVFEKRTRRPPENNVNAMISFGNTVLYNLLASELYRSPLDVRIGFLHSTTKREESLNLDIAEIFKPLVVDRTVFSLINRRIIRKEHFTVCENNGVYLTQEGKRIFLQTFYEKLDTAVSVKDSKMNYNQIISEEVRKLVNHFKNGDKYIPFKQVR